MSSRYPQVSVKDLNTGSEKCTIVVRVLRVYTQSSDKGRWLQTILVDSEGSKISATANQSQYNKFNALREEGQIQEISNFKMALNEKISKSARINHPCKIVFSFNTKVTRFNGEVVIPRNGFQFVMFRDIPSIDAQFTLDVVGTYINHSNMESLPGYNNARKMDVTIVNNENKKLICVLWESYADQLLKFLESRGESKDSFTIALQFVSISRYQGVSRVTTMKGPTILLLDQQSDEISAFVNNVDDQSSLHNSVDDGHLSDWFTPNGCKSVAEILECSESGFYTTVAEVGQIDDAEWYYNSCNHCSKRVKKEVKVGDSCNRCYKIVDKIIPTYHVKLEVNDATGKTNFVLFESTAASIIGKSSADLLETLDENGRLDDFPDEFGVFCDKKWIFRIHVNDAYNLTKNKKDFTVKELSTDQKLISEFATLKPFTVSLVDTIEETSSNSLNTTITPQKRLMPEIEIVAHNQPNSGKVRCSATKVPKKEK